MKPFKSFGNIGLKEDENIVKSIAKSYQIEPDTLKLEDPKGVDFDTLLDDIDSLDPKDVIEFEKGLVSNAKLPDTYPTGAPWNNPFSRFIYKTVKIQPRDVGDHKDPVRVAMVYRLTAVAIVYFIIKQAVKMFVSYKLNSLAVASLNKNYKEGKLYDYIKFQIDKVFLKNKGYSKLSPEEFKKTKWFEKMLSEFRSRKTAKAYFELFTDKAFNALLIAICNSFTSFFLGIFIAIPIRFIFAYLGIKIAGGSIDTVIVNMDGNTVSMGVSYTKYGFEVTECKLYVKNEEGKVVEIDLPRVPRKLYKPDIKDLNEYFKSIKDSDSLTLLKQTKELVDRG